MKSKCSFIICNMTDCDLPLSFRQRSAWPVAAILWSKKSSTLMSSVRNQLWCSELPSNVSMHVSDPPRGATTRSNNQAEEMPCQLPISRQAMGVAVIVSANHCFHTECSVKSNHGSGHNRARRFPAILAVHAHAET